MNNSTNYGQKRDNWIHEIALTGPMRPPLLIALSAALCSAAEPVDRVFTAPPGPMVRLKIGPPNGQESTRTLIGALVTLDSSGEYLVVKDRGQYVALRLESIRSLEKVNGFAVARYRLRTGLQEAYLSSAVIASILCLPVLELLGIDAGQISP
jgi:hypothetical protein